MSPFFSKTTKQVDRSSINLKLPSTRSAQVQKRSAFAFSWMQFSLFLLAIIGLWSGYYFYEKYHELSQNKEAQAKHLVGEVGQLILLPEEETPTIATVADPKAFRNQTLFRSAQTGDKVLVFTAAKKAILYRPSIHKLVEVIPFEISPASVEMNDATSSPRI